MDEFLGRLKKLIYPDKCTICRKLLSAETKEVLCDRCYSHLLKENLCNRCGRPYKIENEGCLCCKEEEDSMVKRTIGLFPYCDHYRKAVLRWKYRGIRRYAKSYADLFVNDLVVTAILELDAFIPVPLAPSRAKKRGFNQAKDLAREMTLLTDIPTYDCLLRTRDTKPQAECTKEQRNKNVKGSIAINQKFTLPQLRRVAIVDDIYTTGSTAKECIKILKQEYAMKDAEFYLLVVCIGG